MEHVPRYVKGDGEREGGGGGTDDLGKPQEKEGTFVHRRRQHVFGAPGLGKGEDSEIEQGGM